MTRGDRTFLKIPILKTVVVPKEDGSGEEIAIFYQPKAYFLLSTEMSDFFDQFLTVEAEVVPVQPAFVTQPHRETAAERRRRLLEGDEPELVPADEPHFTEDELARGDVDPLDSILVGMGIDQHKVNPLDSIMRVNDDAKRDGLDLTEDQLRALVQAVEDGKRPRTVREQAFVKLCDVPVLTLQKSAKFTAEGTRRQIAAARASRLGLGENFHTIPHDLLAYVFGDVTKVVIPDGDGGYTPLKGMVGDTFQLDKFRAKEVEQVPEAKDHPDVIQREAGSIQWGGKSGAQLEREVAKGPERLSLRTRG